MVSLKEDASLWLWGHYKEMPVCDIQTLVSL